MPSHRHAIGITRREWLQVGYSGLLALSMPSIFASAATPKPARAKSVVLVFLTGAPSHIDTFDPKPEAPVEIRGQFKTISTRTPGLAICEHLPQIAARSHQWALVRSMAHHENNHLLATHQVLTGAEMPGAKPDQVASRNDWPCYASALDYLRPRTDGIPSGVTLPTFLVEGPLTWPGQHAGFLGAKHDPWHVTQDPSKPNFKVDTLRFPTEFGIERLANRKTLLHEVDEHRRRLTRQAESEVFTEQQHRALAMLTSGRMARAFAIDQEPEAVRDRYGRHRYGQSLLLARRLVEAGVPLVQANMGIVQTWDNHADIFTTLQNRLLPPLDQGVAALLDDLTVRGLLDDTLIIMLGEFGRTPKIGVLPPNPQAGRDHWAPAFFAWFAGGGVRGGQIIGKTDAHGAYPVTPPFNPADLAATVYDALGVDPAIEIVDRQGRPVRLNGGQAMACIYG